MFKRFKTWFASSPLETGGLQPDLTWVLGSSLVVSAIVSAVAILFALFAPFPNWERLVRDALSVLGTVTILRVLLRYGYVRLVAYGIITSFTLLATYFAYTGIGVRGTSYGLFLIVVMISALFLHRWAAYVMAGIAGLIGLGLLEANHAGLLPNVDRPLPESASWLIQTAYFFSAAIILNLALRRIDLALKRATHELEERKLAEAKILALNIELEQRVAERTAQLAISEERYRLITTVSSDYVFSTQVDQAGNVSHQWVAGAFESIMGCTFEEYIAAGGWASVVHPDNVTQDIHDMAELHQNHPVHTEIRIITKKNEERWVRVYGYPVWDHAENRLAGIYGAVQDMTSRKQTELREQHRRELLEKVIEQGKIVTQCTNLQDCLRQIHQSVQKGLDFDRVGVFLYEEQTDLVRGTYGTSRTGEIEDTSWYSQIAAESTAWRNALNQPTGVTFLHNYTEVIQPPQEDEMFGVQEHVSTAAWVGGKPVALITVDNLITQRAITPERLEALQLFSGYAGLAIENARWNAELEQRVAERTAELEAANQELQGFTYTIAHDLRAPARAIIGFTDLLDESLAAQADLPPTSRSYLLRVLHGAKRMGQMIDELLEYTRLGRLPFRKEPVNMQELVELVLEKQQDKLSKRQIKIVQQKLPPCEGDPIMLEQAWSHLLSNALKFTRPRPVAEIEVGAGIADGVPYYFIRDNGIGFDMQYVHNLFGVFQRLHIEDDFEGTGMGLALVGRIIERHHGRIWVEAEVGKGAAFYFTLGVA